jgi:flagellar assembly factor FliW
MGTDMQVESSRFGTIEIEPEDILLFSRGLFAFENHHHWVLLADADNDSVAWLQSLSDAEVALPLVSPRRFVPGYRVCISRSQLTPLELAALDQAFVLNVINRNHGELTINLKAPVVINLDRRIGRQVVTSDEQPLQMVLPSSVVRLRKSA